ncbi:MAG: hypothetical protein ACREDL_12950 [Bradyrhizobium sp.]
MAGHEKVSRRTWLKNLMLLTAAAGLAPPRARSTEGKVSKSVAHYRDHPNGMQMCGMCKYFRGHGMMGRGMMGGGMMGHGMMGHGMGHGMMTAECQIVEGQISMMGWCKLYSPRDA